MCRCDGVVLQRVVHCASCCPILLTQYIALLRKCNLHERLDAARRSMHVLFPLSEAMWLEWLQDAQQAEEAHDAVVALYEDAVQDYLSVTIWSSYLRCLGCFGLG